MAAFNSERVLSVRHWNEFLFSFTTTRDAGLRFENGQFIMIGLPVDGRPLLRATTTSADTVMSSRKKAGGLSTRNRASTVPRVTSTDGAR